MRSRRYTSATRLQSQAKKPRNRPENKMVRFLSGLPNEAGLRPLHCDPEATEGLLQDPNQSRLLGHGPTTSRRRAANPQPHRPQRVSIIGKVFLACRFVSGKPDFFSCRSFSSLASQTIPMMPLPYCVYILFSQKDHLLYTASPLILMSELRITMVERRRVRRHAGPLT
jgi:hypothetical protein